MRGKKVLFQIIGLMIGGVLLFSVALWTSVISIIDEMNKKSFEDSVVAVHSRIKSLQEQVHLITSDYNNWGDVYNAVKVGDVQFISDNYGITAARGDVFEYAVIFQGPFEEPIAWINGHGLAPVKSFLPEEILKDIRKESELLPMGERDTFDFITLIDRRIVMFSASLLLPEDVGKIDNVPTGQFAAAAIGKILNQSKLDMVEQELGLANMRFMSFQPDDDVPHIQLKDYKRNPIVFLTWDPPKPGSDLLRRMLPILIAVNSVFFVVGVFFAHQAHANALRLIRKEAESTQLARTDYLSQLPNRLAFAEHCDALNNDPKCNIAVIQIDLDRFKQVNDVVGHAGGDDLIRQFARSLGRLKDASTFVARVGGDEFVVICATRSAGSEFWRRKIVGIIDILKDPVECAGLLFDLSASIGVALKSYDTLNVEDIVWRADRAMYHAKQQNISGFVLYDEIMSDGDQERNSIEKAMRNALRNPDEFFIEYQPIMDCSRKNSMVRAEALARWRSPLLGDISASKFISIAEETGLIVPLGWFIIDMICKDLETYPALNVSINVSPVQLMTPGFVDELYSKISAKNIECYRVDIELTETLAISEDSFVMDEVRRLKSYGFSISLDDFGTGFSSLSYIRRIPFNTIKIDKSFISGSEEKCDDYCLVTAIVSLADSMGKYVVAEGVETEQQLIWLRSIGCKFVQGFLVGEPTKVQNLAKRFDISQRFDCVS